MATEQINAPQTPAGRRRHSRLRLNLAGRLITLDGTVSLTLLDLSRTGARIIMGQGLVRGGDAVLNWHRFEAFCTIAWIRGQQCGLDFDEPLPEDVLHNTRTVADADPDRNASRAAARAWAAGLVR
jgi:hypothetical protein